MADSIHPVDYDQIAATYDQRYQENRLEGVERALISYLQDIDPGGTLEVGCGTGRWLKGLSSVNGNLFGLDKSSGMLSQAQQDGLQLNLIQGSAGKLPFKDQSFTLVSCINALHQFRSPQRFVAESWDILKPGGSLIIIGQVPQDSRNHWYLYDFFDGTLETDLRRYPTWETVINWMGSAGYTDIQHHPVEMIRSCRYGQDVFNDPFLKKEGTSQLALLSDQAYIQGIDRIKAALQAAEADGKPLVFRTEIRLDMLTGVKNPSKG